MSETKLMDDKMQRLILNRIGSAIMEKALKLAPVDKGILRNNLYFEVRGDTVYIGTRGVPYADEMEYGSPPKLLSQTDKVELDKWAQRHGLKSGKGIALSIEKRGIKVGTPEKPLHIDSLGRNSYRPFLRTAALQVKPMIREIVKKAMEAK